MQITRPTWTVFYNINSPESDAWVGTGWEFFDKESEADACVARHIEAGNVPSKRPFHQNDNQHLGMFHR